MTYIDLIADFVDSKISVDKFKALFLTKFKSGGSFGSEQEFQALDTLFADVDAYCGDSDLFDPEHDIDENELIGSAVETLKYLRTIKLLKTL